jgi:hypothetical protein
VSPKSTLDTAFWESESDSKEADDELGNSTAERIKSLACPASALPDWDCDDGWIDVLSASPAEAEAQDAVAVPVEETTCLDNAIASEELSAELGLLDIVVGGEAGLDSVVHSGHQSIGILGCQELGPCKLHFCSRCINALDFVLAQTLLCFFYCSSVLFSCFLGHASSPPHCDTFD